MRNFALPVLLATCLTCAAPLYAQNDLGDVVNGVAQSLIAQQLDQRAYVAAQNANTVQAYRAYLDQYPKGMFRSNAERALAQLGASANPNPGPDVGPNPRPGNGLSPAQEEAAIGFSFSQRVAIQRRLTEMGYSTRGADGVWGYNTRSAIANWQANSGQSATGYLTLTQANRLLQGQTGPVVTPPPPPPGGDIGGISAAQAEAALGLTRSQRITLQAQLNKIGYDTGTPDGLWGARTRAALAKWQGANKQSATGYITGAQINLIAAQAGSVAAPTPPGASNDAALEESLLGLSSYERADLQRRLTRLGYSTYGADGAFGRNTRAAIAAWQGDEGLAVTGYLSADEVRKIRVETGG